MIELLDYLQKVLGLINYGAVIGLMIGIVLLLYGTIKSIIFNYYFYIDHGFILIEPSKNEDKVEETLKKLNRNKSIYDTGYLKVLFLHTFITLLLIGFGAGWNIFIPIALVILIIFMPVYIIKVAARKKRNKVIFQEKLNGTHQK